MNDFFVMKPFFAAVIAGASAQIIKVLSFLVVEKKVKYRRFVQPDGSPNMHSAAMSALTLYVGMSDGFGSIVFSLSMCLTFMVMVDTWNVKQAYSQQQELVLLLLDRRNAKHERWTRSRKALSYTPMDVLSGTVLGVVVTLLLV